MIAIRSLNKVRHLLRIQTEIENKTHYDLDEQQKEYFLKQQIKNIREELGEGNASPEKKEILEKAKKEELERGNCQNLQERNCQARHSEPAES